MQVSSLIYIGLCAKKGFVRYGNENKTVKLVKGQTKEGLSVQHSTPTVWDTTYPLKYVFASMDDS